ncbi:ubiquitin carboxyl-terminal hydrolase family protein [Artemisia annua]|uniref:Ubiquitin carboxyl-terminal hydrolase family protein n=1 Tax=Artemisia annua TaxID=35608 RepID=A0A2U1LDV7_ARTAN|nr:ubiquitin carboxyl-terminal hydrolase family protein [Artemisia annua]
MLRWDLGFSYDYDKVLSSKYSDMLEVVKDENGVRFFKLVKWVDEFAVSELERRFKRGENGLGFELSFPRGYGAQKKVKLWMDEFKKVPYVSPYEDSSSIDPDSELMEKRVVGVLHELLSLTVYKKTKRNYIRNLADELNIPFRFTRIFTRYPGIFYLSLKCKTTSVMLKEGYRKGKLVNPCDIAKYRGKFHYVMRTGLIYRKKGLEMLPELDKVDVDVNDVIGVHLFHYKLDMFHQQHGCRSLTCEWSFTYGCFRPKSASLPPRRVEVFGHLIHPRHQSCISSRSRIAYPTLLKICR